MKIRTSSMRPKYCTRPRLIISDLPSRTISFLRKTNHEDNFSDLSIFCRFLYINVVTILFLPLFNYCCTVFTDITNRQILWFQRILKPKNLSVWDLSIISDAMNAWYILTDSVGLKFILSVSFPWVTYSILQSIFKSIVIDTITVSITTIFSYSTVRSL